MKLKEIMSQPVQSVSEDTRVDIVARLMLEKSIGCLPVLDSEGKLTGVITHDAFVSKEKTLAFSRFHYLTLLGDSLQDGMEKVYEKAKNMLAREIMRRNPATLTEDDTVKTFLETISEHGVTHIPIVRDGSVIGIVARQDLLKMVADTNKPDQSCDRGES